MYLSSFADHCRLKQMGNDHVGQTAFCLKHNRSFLFTFKMPRSLTHASSESRFVLHINWTLTPHFCPASHNPTPSHTFWFPILFYYFILLYHIWNCNVMVRCYFFFNINLPFSEDYSHLWGRFMCLGKSARFCNNCFQSCLNDNTRQYVISLDFFEWPWRYQPSEK